MTVLFFLLVGGGIFMIFINYFSRFKDTEPSLERSSLPPLEEREHPSTADSYHTLGVTE